MIERLMAWSLRSRLAVALRAGHRLVSGTPAGAVPLGMLKAQFAVLDKNKDGFLTEEEMAAGQKKKKA